MKIPFGLSGGGSGPTSGRTNLADVNLDMDEIELEISLTLTETDEASGPVDFSEYYWMEYLEEFDKTYWQDLVDEELTEECIENNEVVEMHLRQQVELVDGTGVVVLSRAEVPETIDVQAFSYYMENIARAAVSTLNPLAEEFIPSSAY